MKIIVCPVCGCWKFLYDEKTIWLEPTSEEKLAIEIIKKSEPLLVLVDGLEIIKEKCINCKLAKLN